MANEAVLQVETHIPLNFTCATGTTIEKGAICKMTSGMVAVLSDGANDIVAGIVQSEKLAAETSQDSVSIYRGGIFRVLCHGSITSGDPVTTGAGSVNGVVIATVDDENILGIMLEDATEGQTKLMELRITKIQTS